MRAGITSQVLAPVAVPSRYRFAAVNQRTRESLNGGGMLCPCGARAVGWSNGGYTCGKCKRRVRVRVTVDGLTIEALD